MDCTGAAGDCGCRLYLRVTSNRFAAALHEAGHGGGGAGIGFLVDLEETQSEFADEVTTAKIGVH